MGNCQCMYFHLILASIQTFGVYYNKRCSSEYLLFTGISIPSPPLIVLYFTSIMMEARMKLVIYFSNGNKVMPIKICPFFLVCMAR